MQFTPLHDRVLVRRIEGEEKTKGGLIVPDTAKEKPSEGEVISVGEGARKEAGELIPMAVKAGDRILFGKWSGSEVRIDGEDLLIMKEATSSASSTATARPRRPPDRGLRQTHFRDTKGAPTDGRQAAEIRHRRA